MKKNDSKIDFIGEFEENVTGYIIFLGTTQNY